MKNTNLSRALVAVFSLALVAPVFAQTAKPSAPVECKDCKDAKGGQKLAGKRDACAIPLSLLDSRGKCAGLVEK